MNQQNDLTFRIISEKFYHLAFQSLYFEICQINAFLLQMLLFIPIVCLKIEGIEKLDRKFKGLLWIELRFGPRRNYLDAHC